MLLRSRRRIIHQAKEAYMLSVKHGLKVPGFRATETGYLYAGDDHDKQTDTITIAIVRMNDAGKVTEVKELSSSPVERKL